jgi:hypothetical protein
MSVRGKKGDCGFGGGDVEPFGGEKLVKCVEVRVEGVVDGGRWRVRGVNSNIVSVANDIHHWWRGSEVIDVELEE